MILKRVKKELPVTLMRIQICMAKGIKCYFRHHGNLDKCAKYCKPGYILTPVVYLQRKPATLSCLGCYVQDLYGDMYWSVNYCFKINCKDYILKQVIPTRLLKGGNK